MKKIILKFSYHGRGYFSTDNCFYVDFEKNTVSDESQKYDKEVVVAKLSELDELREFFKERMREEL